MCVIAISDKERITEEMVRKMYSANDAGAGIAWREKVEGVPVVRWKKGLKVEEIVELASSAPLPFIAHFRIPSCGGKSLTLTHPFPIEKNVRLLMEGTTQGHVLFHNGHWTQWKDKTLETAIRKGARLPSGKWSDSRAMAWIASFYGLGVLDMIDEKVVAFGPTTCEISGSGWAQIKPGIWASNRGWENVNLGRDNSYFTRDHRHHHGGKATEEDKDKIQEGLVVPNGAASRQGPGGAPTAVPFTQSLADWDLAEMMYKKGSITKSAWKNAKKKFEKAEKKEKRRVSKLPPDGLVH